LRIGIDARFLTHPQPGGFKTYTTNLLSALNQVDKDDEFIVYLDRHPTKDVMLPDSSNFTYRIVDGTRPIVGMPFREQVGLRLQMIKDRLDVMHFLCNTATVGLMGKYIVTLHDTIQLTTMSALPGNNSDLRHWIINGYSKQSILWAVRRAYRVITVSEYVRAEISRTLGIPIERITVTQQAPNPIFRQADECEKQLWRQDVKQRFGIHGRFILGVGYEPRKNIPLLINAFARVAVNNADLSLVLVVAEGLQRSTFQHLVAELGLADRVVVLGAIALLDLVRLYNLADLFVFPSEREGYGLPPLEAMACGLPTIVMNMTSLPEVVLDGALLVDGKDITVWAGTIQQVIADENLRTRLREQGLRRVAMLSWDRCAERTVDVYHAAVFHSPK
jgi:glycosyltransferase involved in cell wall biosynthesis